MLQPLDTKTPYWIIYYPIKERPQPGDKKAIPSVARKDIDLVQYDATIPDYEDEDVPLLLGDPGR